MALLLALLEHPYKLFRDLEVLVEKVGATLLLGGVEASEIVELPVGLGQFHTVIDDGLVTGQTEQFLAPFYIRLGGPAGADQRAGGRGSRRSRRHGCGDGERSHLPLQRTRHANARTSIWATA